MQVGNLQILSNRRFATPIGAVAEGAPGGEKAFTWILRRRHAGQGNQQQKGDCDLHRFLDRFGFPAIAYKIGPKSYPLR